MIMTRAHLSAAVRWLRTAHARADQRAAWLHARRRTLIDRAHAQPRDDRGRWVRKETAHV